MKTEEQPLISCIVPVYNMEQYLKRCLDSCINQSMGDFELIIVDDGSTDRSAQICDDYAVRDKRIQVIHQKNAGVAAAKNTGMAHARGKYVVFVDSDDYVDSDYLFELAKGIASESFDVVFAGVRFLQESNLHAYAQTDYRVTGRIAKDQFAQVLALMIDDEVINFHVAKLYRRQLIEENKITFTDFRESGGDDTIFIMDILCVSETILLVNKPIYNYIIYTRSTSHSYTGDRWKRGKKLDTLLKERCIRICGKDIQDDVQRALDNRIALLGLWSSREIAQLPITDVDKKCLIEDLIMDIRFQEACQNDVPAKKNKEVRMLSKKKVVRFLINEKIKKANVKGWVYSNMPPIVIRVYHKLCG